MNTPFTRWKSWSYALAVIAFGLLPLDSAWARAEVGRVQFVHGDVQIMDAGGARRAMLQREAVHEGDTLISAKSGYAQLRMIDDAVIALRPDTVLRVDTYYYHADQRDGSERGFFFLLKGGFRAITGAIGRNNKQNYLVTTPVATVGIRGTDHEPMYIPMPAPGEIAIGEPGVYDLVNAGSAYIQTSQGRVAINPNEVGYVPDINATPTILPSLPDFYKTSARPMARGKGAGQTQAVREVSKVDGKVKSVAASPDGDVNPYTVVPDRGIVQPITDANGNINFAAVGADATPAPVGTGVVGADIFLDGQGQLRSNGRLHVADGSPDKGIYLNDDQSVNAIADQTLGGGYLFVAGKAQLVEAGGHGDIRWGRWSGDSLRAEGGEVVNPLGNYHYMYSPNLTTPTQLAAITGSFTYNYVGGTAPTDERGTVGRINSASVAVDFTKQQITNYSLSLTIPANFVENWTASGNGSFKQFTGTGIALSGVCSGCGGSTSTAAVGNAYGAFVGPQANGMISAFALQAGGNGVVGTAAFER
ncbi:MAG: FecR domain-containing protein [Gammaproteobacteria bacterium]|nr:FecR domain-containing protein [Gammaproteobacteria bacterium]